MFASADAEAGVVARAKIRHLLARTKAAKAKAEVEAEAEVSNIDMGLA